MAQARTPAGSSAGAGAGQYIVDATQIPTDITWPDTASLINRMRDGVVWYKMRDAADSSADFTWFFQAEANGKIEALVYENGAVAVAETHGWELDFKNADNSSETVAYIGLGSGTEAAKATDSTTAVAANAAATVLNTTAKNFDRGDRITVTADRDETTVVGSMWLVVNYGSEGTADD